MELILFLVIALAVTGGFQWCFKRFLEARDFTRRFLGDHPHSYRLACAVSLLCGTIVAVALSQEREPPSVGELVAFGFVTALLLLPVTFGLLLVIGFLVRTVILPAVQVVGYIFWPLRSLVRGLAEPARRKAESLRFEQERATREEEVRSTRRDQKRRETARSRCEVLYHLHAPEIGKRFTRPMFDDYLRKYMGDSRDPDEVEERAAQLEALLMDHVERVQPAPKFKSLEDIARWFEDQKRELAKLPDDKLRQTMLAKLKARYTEITTEFLEEMRA